MILQVATKSNANIDYLNVSCAKPNDKRLFIVTRIRNEKML